MKRLAPVRFLVQGSFWLNGATVIGSQVPDELRVFLHLAGQRHLSCTYCVRWSSEGQPTWRKFQTRFDKAIQERADLRLRHMLFKDGVVDMWDQEDGSYKAQLVDVVAAWAHEREAQAE
ncbi:MAG: hypothetical protein U1F10_00530 [Burkholderiales bacterium]